MLAKICVVNMIWCDESNSWFCKSEDIPGLVLGSPSFDKLVERIRFSAPEMLEANLDYKGPIEIQFTIDRTELLYAV